MLLPFKGADAQFGRIIAELIVFVIFVEDVQTKAIRAAIQPETEDIHHFGVDGRIVPVQIGLLFDEHVKVILTASFIKLPALSAKDRLPVIGWILAVFGIAPDVPIAIFTVFGTLRGLKPGMLV
ncbi:hypothetical protein SDC9_110579 [bioreactor metagenome]|uniref:Uncharacterized protein n=1 Tax=bioreactor metagenome TaxID=1076179 RepID=A0A645BEE0_9ZZZZ